LHEVNAKGLDVVSNGIDFLLYISLNEFKEFLYEKSICFIKQ
jgi:hypothetical protein